MAESGTEPALSPGDVRSQVAASEDRTVPTLRKVRRRISHTIHRWSPAEVLDLAVELLRAPEEVPRWFVYELVHHHPGSLAALDATVLARLGEGMSAWGEVDPFGCYLAGPAWRERRLPDETIHVWATSPDRWWRRAALVSTVALNSTARGGSSDAARTLAVCDLLRADRDDMVVKAMSWALRQLVKREPAAVAEYLAAREDELASRVLREVRSKLETALKRPR